MSHVCPLMVQLVTGRKGKDVPGCLPPPPEMPMDVIQAGTFRELTFTKFPQTEAACCEEV